VREALVRDLEAARYAADRAFRHMTPPTQPTASWLVNWKHVEGKIAAHDAEKAVPPVDPASLMTLATGLKSVWTAPTTDARLKKHIVRTLIHEVVVDTTIKHPRSFCSSIGWAAFTARCAYPDGGGDSATAHQSM
jgi:hypothetical protein